MEALRVYDYVEKLISDKCYPTKPAQLSEIGIITPYRGQYRMLQEEANKRNWKNLKIGSPEMFLGQQRPIIIVSMVRSDTSNLGFLDNFRVMIVTLNQITVDWHEYPYLNDNHI